MLVYDMEIYYRKAMINYLRFTSAKKLLGFIDHNYNIPGFFEITIYDTKTRLYDSENMKFYYEYNENSLYLPTYEFDGFNLYDHKFKKIGRNEFTKILTDHKKRLAKIGGVR